jgi:hypothetical protein
MGRKSGGDDSRGAGGHGASWAEKHLGPGWVEVEPGIYELLLSEVRTQSGLPSSSPTDDDEPDRADEEEA